MAEETSEFAEFEIAGDAVVTENENSVSLDILNTVELDLDRDEQERRKLFAPSGDYLKEDVWEEKIEFNADDSQPDDLGLKLNPPKPGRCIISFTGKAENIRTKEQWQFYFRMSPDVRPMRNNPEKADMMHQLYLQAQLLHERLYESQTKQPLELVAMLKKGTYILVNRATDTGAFINAFKTKGQR